MPISQVELMEFFMRTVMRPDVKDAVRTPVDADLSGSFFEAPSEYLEASSATLEELQAGQPNLLLALANAWERKEEAAYAQIIRDVEKFLVQNSNKLSTSEPAVRRLIDYVYPVV